MKRLRTQALTLFARATAATETLAAEMKGAIPLWPEGATERVNFKQKGWAK